VARLLGALQLAQLLALIPVASPDYGRLGNAQLGELQRGELEVDAVLVGSSMINSPRSLLAVTRNPIPPKFSWTLYLGRGR
jgi:hypothetical protein